MARCNAAGGGCPRVAAVLLAHVNVLLVLYSGAGLAMAARLKWDPSAYVPVREALPREYRLMCGALLAGALATLLLAHIALAALFARRPLVRSATLYIYALLMLCVVGAEVWGALWAYGRVAEWAASRNAQQLLDLLQARDHILAALQLLAKWFPLPEKLNELIKEMEQDIPRNAYAAGGAAVALVALQASAALLAVGAARRPRPRPRPVDDDDDDYLERDDSRTRLTFHSEPRPQNGKIRTKYKNGRLVIV